MKKLIDFCKFYNVKISIEHEQQLGGIKVTISRKIDGVTNACNILIDADECDKSAIGMDDYIIYIAKRELHLSSDYPEILEVKK